MSSPSSGLTPLLIPRLLFQRDPRNPAHVSAALEIIAEIGEVYATDRTIEELTKAGVSLRSKKIKRQRKRSPKMDAMIGGFFFLDRGLLFPDNLICTCSECRAALQIRPHSAQRTKLCAFCATDKVLKSYWAEQSASDDTH